MKGKASGELNGFLDRGASFKGEMEFEDTMRIDGKFNGKIMSKNELIVGESAQANEATPKLETPSVKIRRSPNRSPSDPPTRISELSVSR